MANISVRQMEASWPNAVYFRIMLLIVFKLTQTHLNDNVLHVPAATFVQTSLEFVLVTFLHIHIHLDYKNPGNVNVMWCIIIILWSNVSVWWVLEHCVVLFLRACATTDLAVWQIAFLLEIPIPS